MADGATTTAGAGDAIAAIVNHAPESRGRLSWRSLSFIQAVADSREITPYLWVHPDEDGEEMAQPRGKLGDAAGPCQVSNAVPLSTNPSAQSNLIT